MKRELCNDYKGKATRSDLQSWLNLPRSTGYYEPSNERRGKKPSLATLKVDGSLVSNETVIDTLISDVFSQEFNRYGYRLCTEDLKEMGFVINHKKTYRLMKEHGLLLDKITVERFPRQWVKWRKIIGAKPMEYLCMDIKYIHIHGAGRNAFLLAIMDVATRYVLGWYLNFGMKHTDVILCLHQSLQGIESKEIILRTDNGSQFIAHGLRKYCISRGIAQEFTHIATPEENAYIESLFSCVEREVVQSYEFSSIYHARDVFDRYFQFHNTKRRRHALGRKSPLKYWNTVFYSHPVKPPAAQRGGFVKGDDNLKNQISLSSLVLPLTKPIRELSLLNQDENMSNFVLNHS
jgi:transposase InsO family protein